MTPGKEYCALIDEICQQALIPNPAGLYQNTQLDVNNISFTLFERNLDGFTEIFIHCDVGPLPRSQCEEVLLRLLEINFHLLTGARSPRYAWNAQTERVTLSVVLPLEAISASSLLSLMEQLANMAKSWRDDYFLISDRPVNVAHRSESFSS